MKKYGENSSIHKKKITPNIKDMKQLKQGTPVWVGKTPRIYVSTNEFGQHHTSRLLKDDSVIDSLDSVIGKPLTISEYIEHVMVPDGWDNQKASVWFGDFIQINNTHALSKKKATPLFFKEESMDSGYFHWSEKDLSNAISALTHCERLNILKELENQ